MANTFKSALATSVGATASTIYTVPTLKSAVLIGCTVANTITTQISVSVVLNRTGQDYFIVKGALVPIGSAFVWTGGELKTVVMAGDAIKVVSSDPTSADVILSYLEIA